MVKNPLYSIGNKVCTQTMIWKNLAGKKSKIIKVESTKNLLIMFIE